MQHAVHNRATIRVADRTDVIGRATAGSINDRSRVKRQTTLWRISGFRKVCALVAATFLCLGIVLSASNAVAQQKTLKELIVGTWLLDSVYDQTQDGVKHEPWGPGVKGIAMYDGTGHYSLQIMAADRSKTASNNPRMPVGQVSCHFGTYTVDEAAKTMSTQIERCTFPQWDGGDGTVNIAFPTEDDLSITVVVPIQDPTMGPMMPHLFFKRVK